MNRKLSMRSALLALAVLSACGLETPEASGPSENAEQELRRRPKPPPTVVDAGTQIRDAGTPPPAATGTVSCYTQGAPSTTCQQPDHCCFDNYSAKHNGYCAPSPRSCYGDVSCDGPEDCPNGGSCCAVGIKDPTGTFVVPIGYRISCQAGPCEAAPTVREMCHPGTSPAGTCSNPSAQCVAFSDFPAGLTVCK